MERFQNLDELWYLQSSEKVKGSGAQISTSGYDIRTWYPAVVPSTVLGTLVQNDVYRDIFFGQNLKNVPEAPFRTSWWYRREFLVEGGLAPAPPKAGGNKPPEPGPTAVALEFDGLNYRANVWINGQKIADAKDLFGAFRRFELDITKVAPAGQKAVLAVEVFPPVPGEPTIGFVDWSPAPPDRNMGLFRQVRVRTSGPVAVRAPFVRAKLNLETLAEARLTVSAELRNTTDAKVKAKLEGRIESIRFSRDVELEPRASKTVVFTPEEFPELVVSKPRLWWTHDLGRPELYALSLTCLANGKPSDAANVRFGIREVEDYVNEQGWRGYKLNGRKILIRSGGWSDELLLDVKPRKLEAEVLYAVQSNLNSLRLEGFWGTSPALYDLCDRLGLLLLAGWSCHWEWAPYLGKPVDEVYGGITSDEDIDLVAKSWRDQVRWLRNHPSILVWLLASDLLPAPKLEEAYRKILAEDDPTRPVLVSAGDKTSPVSGRSRVKMNGPYDYVPPNYWYIDTKRGGAFGFNTESGPGSQVPPAEAMRRMIPEDELWPIGETWFFHTSRGRFKDLGRYNEALTARLGAPRDLEDYCAKAQYLNYEGMRAMFEAFVANKHKATGVVQWMYNSAWPKVWWQLYDYSLLPTGALYGARQAGEPRHILYHYGTGDILAVNNGREPAAKLQASVRVLGLDMKILYSRTLGFDLGPDEVRKIDAIPADLPALSPTYFLDLRITDKDKKPVSTNFYALSTRPDVLDEQAATWFVTPAKQYADLTALTALPQAEVRTREKFKVRGNGTELRVELENPSATLAFMVELRIEKGETGQSALPVFLEDNYFALLPGEKRIVEGFVFTEDLGGEEPRLRVSWWNNK
jgi:exo-1,4-beta-D-glucosaminidase